MRLYERLRESPEGPPALRAARRPALRQRQHPYRPRAQQDPEGPRRPLAGDARLRLQLRARLGLPRPADRVEDRGAVPRQGQEQGRGVRSSSSAASAAPSPSSGSTCSARSSSASASSGDWANPYLTMDFDAEAQIAREIMKFAMTRPALSRLEAGDVVRRSRRPRWPRPRSSITRRPRTTIWVKFPITEHARRRSRRRAPVVIWTTTPWTIPANRAIAYRRRTSPTASTRSRKRPTTTGPRSATVSSSPTSSPPTCSRPRAVAALRAREGRAAGDARALRASVPRARRRERLLGFRACRCCRPIT